MARSDLPFGRFASPRGPSVVSENNGSNKGLPDWILNEKLMNPLAGLVAFEVILENSCLRLGRRNEEETSAHCLSTHVSSPTAAITLLTRMMSCGISICSFGCVRPVRGSRSTSVIYSKSRGKGEFESKLWNSLQQMWPSTSIYIGTLLETEWTKRTVIS